MWRLLSAIFILMFAVSCSTALKVEPVSSEYIKPTLKYFVENHGEDNRHLEKIIATEMQKTGLNARSGYKNERPDDIDILVIYEDRWQWDMSNYLIHLRIDLRSPKTNILLGTGSSYQTSLARKSEQEIIENIVSGMFKK